MLCRKCKKDIPDESVFCNYCGIKQNSIHKPKQKGNGTGCVYKLPNGKWRAEITLGYDNIDGVLKRKARTKSGFRTKKEAEEYLPQLRIAPKTLSKRITFKRLYEEWYPVHCQKVGASTMDCYKAAYKHCAALYYEDFTAIRTEDWQKCIDNCGHGIRTKENMKALGTLMYKYAMQYDLINKNYAEYIYLKHEVQKRREYFHEAERNILWDKAKEVKNIEYVLCLIYTGFRPGEMLALKKENYNGKYFIGGAKTPKGTDRIVTVSPLIKPFVDRLAEKDGFIFSENGKKMSKKKFYALYYKVLEDCGISKKEPYCCRHTFATLMKEVNAPDEDKHELIGHTSSAMTEYYTHTEIEELKKITDNML